MSTRLVAHSRLALREARGAGLLDDDMYAEADALMDELGVVDGAPVVMDGDGWVVELQGWLDRMPRRYAASTRRRYAQHALRLFTHLQDRGLTFADVDAELLASWAQHRQSGRSGSSWTQEEQALMGLFGWLASPDNPDRVFEVSPWPLWRSGARVTSRLAARPSSLSRRVRMLDDVEWGWFRNVGLAGGAAGAALAPRFPQRDVALGDLLVTTGLRLNEARLLLIDEIPQPGSRQRQQSWPNTMLFAGGARAKTRGGWVPFVPEVGDRIWDWWESPARQAMVRAAQPTLCHRLNAGLLFVVEETVADRGRLTFGGRWLGREVWWTADTMPWQPAAAAVRVEAGRVVPLTIWQTDVNGGQPMSASALRALFAEATVRVTGCDGHPLGDDLLRARRQPDGGSRVVGGVSPHMLRHTAAVNWLVELTLESRRRAGQLQPVRHHNLPSAGPFDPMFYVRTWLRHVTVDTTLQYQTWVHRQDWPADRRLGAGVAALVADREPPR